MASFTWPPGDGSPLRCVAFYPPGLRGCVGSGCPLTSELQRPRDHEAIAWGESTKGVAAVVLGGGDRARDHITHGAGERAKCHGDGDGDAPLHSVTHGGADAWRQRLRGLIPPRSRPRAKDAEFEVKPLSHYLDVKIRYPQSTKERHYLLLIYGEVSRVSQKCMWRHIYTP